MSIELTIRRDNSEVVLVDNHLEGSFPFQRNQSVKESIETINENHTKIIRLKDLHQHMAVLLKYKAPK